MQDNKNSVRDSVERVIPMQIAAHFVKLNNISIDEKKALLFLQTLVRFCIS